MTPTATGSATGRREASELTRQDKYVREKAKREQKRQGRDNPENAEKRLDDQLNKYWNKDCGLKS